MAGAMARDYKHAVAGAKTGRKTSTRSRKRGDEARQGSSMSFISGLGAGLLVAFVALLYGEPLRNQLNNMIPVDSDSGVGAAPQQRDALAEAPDYRFYKILPEMEVTVPDWELEPGPSRAAPACCRSDPSGAWKSPRPPRPSWRWRVVSRRGSSRW